MDCQEWQLGVCGVKESRMEDRTGLSEANRDCIPTFSEVFSYEYCDIQDRSRSICAS